MAAVSHRRDVKGFPEARKPCHQKHRVTQFFPETVTAATTPTTNF